MRYHRRMIDITYNTDSLDFQNAHVEYKLGHIDARLAAAAIAFEADLEIANLEFQLAEAQAEVKRLTTADTSTSQKTWRLLKLIYNTDSFCDICDCNPTTTHQVEDPDGLVLEICWECGDARLPAWELWAGK